MLTEFCVPMYTIYVYNILLNTYIDFCTCYFLMILYNISFAYKLYKSIITFRVFYFGYFALVYLHVHGNKLVSTIIFWIEDSLKGPKIVFIVTGNSHYPCS